MAHCVYPLNELVSDIEHALLRYCPVELSEAFSFSWVDDLPYVPVREFDNRHNRLVGLSWSLIRDVLVGGTRNHRLAYGVLQLPLLSDRGAQIRNLFSLLGQAGPQMNYLLVHRKIPFLLQVRV